MKKKTLALFDFDGTITKKDTLLDIVLFSFGCVRFFAGIIRLSPFFILHFLKKMDNQTLKEKYISYFFSGYSYEQFVSICRNYAVNRLPAIVYGSALERIKFHQKENHTVVIVSASFREWIYPWASAFRITDVISTDLDVENGRITGRIHGKNCYGKEKVDKISGMFNLEEYYVYAYGDSRGDREMLSCADEKYYRIFS